MNTYIYSLLYHVYHLQIIIKHVDYRRAFAAYLRLVGSLTLNSSTRIIEFRGFLSQL